MTFQHGFVYMSFMQAAKQAKAWHAARTIFLLIIQRCGCVPPLRTRHEVTWQCEYAMQYVLVRSGEVTQRHDGEGKQGRKKQAGNRNAHVETSMCMSCAVATMLCTAASLRLSQPELRAARTAITTSEHATRAQGSVRRWCRNSENLEYAWAFQSLALHAMTGTLAPGMIHARRSRLTMGNSRGNAWGSLLKTCHAMI
jgi:hypothetical protein